MTTPRVTDAMTLEQVLETLRAKFKSGNSIPVERATITMDEFRAIDAHLSAQRECDGTLVAWDGDQFTCPVTRFDWTQDGMEPVPQNQSGPNEYVRFEDFVKFYTHPPKPREAVTDEMVKKACEAYFSVTNRRVRDGALRAALEAALANNN